MGNSARRHVDDIVIRPAVQADAEAVGKLWERLVLYHHQLDAHLPTASSEGARIYAERIAERIHDTHTHTLVADDHGRIVGFVMGLIMDMVPEIFEQEIGGFLADIFVEEDYRRTGIGRRLVDALTDWFRSRGVQHIEWYVAAHNQDGRAFWESVGGRDIMIRMRMDL